MCGSKKRRGPLIVGTIREVFTGQHLSFSTLHLLSSVVCQTVHRFCACIMQRQGQRESPPDDKQTLSPTAPGNQAFRIVWQQTPQWRYTDNFRLKQCTCCKIEHIWAGTYAAVTSQRARTRCIRVLRVITGNGTPVALIACVQRCRSSEVIFALIAFYSGSAYGGYDSRVRTQSG